jgi:hypothetical protein
MTIYVPKESVAIDGSVIKYRGHISLCRFQSIQSARVLIKLYVSSESNSDCCVIFKICTGDDLVEGSDKNASESILLELAESVLVKGYIL